MKKCIIIVITLLYGFIGVNMVFASDGTWTQKADFGGTARGFAVGFSIGNKGYIGGGVSTAWNNDFWEYDPANDTWTQKADFGGGVRVGGLSFGFSIQ
ncbi:MAG: hypothetical protein NTW65_09645 [Deltaproteobacteria bacterium]|nr:hypothetical protein [Deltaproteobacteria bacterium]